ncbi:MAG: hypothetical protein K6F47_02400 [Bacteroidaceae bacterium]|nr:hypothetical protein [Bacteroidaceae bacterium]
MRDQYGILSGRVESYRSDEELREALDSEFHKGDKEWRKTHGKGKYIILNPRDSEKGHYSVGAGIKNGSLRYQDSMFNRDAVGSSYGSYSLRDNDKNDDNKEVRWIVFYME